MSAANAVRYIANTCGKNIRIAHKIKNTKENTSVIA